MQPFLGALGASLLLGLVACASPGNVATNGEEPQRSVAEPIIGGHLDEATKGVVALVFKVHNQLAVSCSGSLLAPNLVLTARHCIAQIGDGSSDAVHCDTSVFTGKYDPRQMYVSTDSQPKAGGQLYAVKETREAPGSNKVCGFDVALLILSGTGIPGTAATPIEPVLDTPTRARVYFSAVGYGLQDPNDTQGATAGSRMRFDTSSVACVGASCLSATDTADDEFDGNSPVCSGDSGGPALDSQGRVFGVTSRGDPACTFGLYSNVASWAAFVRSTALDAADSGGYAPLAWATADGVVDFGENAGAGGEPNAAGGSSAGGLPSPGGLPSAGGAANRGTGGRAAGGKSGDTAASNGGSVTDDTASAPPPVRAVSPKVDILGAACATTADCPGTYQCYSASSSPPGMCVPPCKVNGAACPADYSCSVGLNVCTPSLAPVTESQVSSSCALGSTPSSGAGTFVTLGVVGALWFGRRRRRVG